ncbi:hypothetical protein [Campylobacter hyointestinalis]|uniref:DUF721 domain-containing protein n=1 Tax=Campylobacter hyointestinalis subsp. hyointestinalis TaxID=91352 RepID=A0A0S4T0B6_CAMHY|nr:hypothetical protein [Campylobacter hyointestinalis]PPB52835.1 hypothetical protein CDQ69_07370 [Campylobacter hyointestinalis subsp. hyointestinalis]PPB62122.1 hypothetical protein CDQ72_03230 [Campylobacter hyointestinalis subsp. hyointestinalis]PPB62651.1 hypothetical protein CDQ73_06660 [Campylobacter hyointestinalis subsp. hyointestinalis]PPB65811.1 hypothetical protein CDQ75_07490 [Campylobacter hyointestinalis subsp. hyointestinalis]PPB72692.1 hypothetical protein CDQ79_05935 [Campyl
MKSFEIIDHILQNPLYKNLKTSRELRNLLSLLGRSKASLIKFAYQKQNIMYIALTHPLALQELKNDNNINQIKSLLKQYVKFNPNSNLKEINEIKFFIAKIVKFKEVKWSNSSKIIEKSDGNFLNLAKNKEIYEAFENLRKAILINAKR